MKYLKIYVLIFIFVIAVFVAANPKELDFLRALDDSIAYRIVFKPADEFPSDLLAASGGSAVGGGSEQSDVKPDEEADSADEAPPATVDDNSDSSSKVVRVVTADSEQYKCVLPTLAPSSKKRIESYHGPGPAELLQSIYNEQICSFRIEPYWSYELCHGRYVLQFHENKETKRRTEYFLGNFNAKQAETEAKSFDQLNPPTHKVGDDRLAYFPVTYVHGTACDLTGKPRQTTVMYVCDEEARQNVYSINEVSSCHYEMVVLSSEICAHPSFQRPASNDYEIKCYPSVMPTDVEEDEKKSDNDEPDPKPKALLAMEEEQRNEYFNEFSLFTGGQSSSPAQSAKKVFSKILKVDENLLEDGFNQLNAILEAIKKSTGNLGGAGTGPAGGGVPPQSVGAPPKVDEAQLLVDRFWRGDVCLQGGTGWWKHEVCLGRTVSQFHEDPTSKERRQTILLGKFDEAVHKAWAAEHPDKVVERKLDGTVIQIAQLYSQGDICTETGAHRDCQLRIRCRDDIATRKVFIYMLEPSTCSYVVVLESSLFCPKLQHVDEHGLFTTTAGIKETGAQATSSADGEQPSEASATKTGRHKLGSTTLEFDLLNQDEILRVVKNLLEGAELDGQQQQQVLITTAKVKIGNHDAEEEAEGEGEGGEGNEGGTAEETPYDETNGDMMDGAEEEGTGGLVLAISEEEATDAEEEKQESDGEEIVKREEKRGEEGRKETQRQPPKQKRGGEL